MPDALRRWGLIAESFVPALAPRPGAAACRPGRPFTVATFNACRGEHHAPAQAEAIDEAVAEVDADVVIVVEHSLSTQAALARTALAERLPHVVDDPETRPPACFGAWVAARHPVAHADWCDLGGRPGLVVDLDVDGTGVRVVPVHTQAPIRPHDVPLWHSTLAASAATARSAPGPTILAGDWNATGGHRAFRRALRAEGLLDAQAQLHQRWAPTWPQRGPLAPRPIRELPLRPPPVLTLDHVVVTPDITVEGLARVPVPGTDHMGLIARLRLPG